MRENIFSLVEESARPESVRVTHRLLRVPRQQYLEHTAAYGEDDSEQNAQRFVAEYMASKGEQGGIVGMVRCRQQQDWLLMDAAVRYPRLPSGNGKDTH